MTETQDFIRCVGPECVNVMSHPVTGLCEAHKVQSRKGNGLSVIGTAGYTVEEDCEVDGCSRVVHSRKMCYGHYQHMLRKGFTTPLPARDEDLCSTEGCTRRVKSKGFCPTHYNKYRVSQSKICSFESCERKTESHGLCSTHNNQRRAGKELTPIRVWGSYTRGSACPLAGCDKPSTGRRGCVKHAALSRTYNLSLEEIGALRTECSVCGSKQNLTVDHDHACCDRFGSCGKCVRDILCTNCNTALGHVKDSKDRLRGLIAYLERFEV